MVILAFIVQIVKDLNPPPVVKIDLSMHEFDVESFSKCWGTAFSP